MFASLWCACAGRAQLSSTKNSFLMQALLGKAGTTVAPEQAVPVWIVFAVQLTHQFINSSWRDIMNRQGSLKLLAASIALGLGLAGHNVAHATDTAKAGILSSLSGTMAISEIVLMAIRLPSQDMQAKGVILLVAL
jgi:hypothetical protein